VLAAGAGSVTGTDIITTVAGTGVEGFSGDGAEASAAQLKLPFGVAVDSLGNVFIADSGNHRVRKVTPGGVITTVAGTGTAGFSGDNGPAVAAQLNSPIFLALDGAGNLYIADQGNNRVRKVGTDGTITTVAGRSGAALPPPPPGAAVPATSVSLNLPTGIAVDGTGNLYIADQANRVVRKVSGGMITTVAGLGPEGSGGEGRKYAFTPCGLAVDGAGNLYIGEVSDHRVSKLTNGVLTTIAGTGAEGFSGDGGPATAAQLNDPCGVAVDQAGNLYIADVDNSRVRRVAAAGGVITTVAGTGTRGAGGDNGPAANADLHLPRGVAVDAAGNLYIADTVSSKVRKVAAASAPAPTAPAPAGPGATATVAAVVDAVTTGTSRLGKRIVRLELTLEENVAATLTLVRKGTTLATKRFARVKAGSRTLILPLGGGIASGKATLRIALTDLDGNKLRVRRPVRVPPAG
jgi:sugar lactone lactonase YvrE